MLVLLLPIHHSSQLNRLQVSRALAWDMSGVVDRETSTINKKPILSICIESGLLLLVTKEFILTDSLIYYRENPFITLLSISLFAAFHSFSKED